MQKYTRPFVPSVGIGQLKTFSGTGNDNFYTLNVFPGNPMATYESAQVAPLIKQGYKAAAGRVTNFLTFGFSSTASANIASYSDAMNIADPVSATPPNTFNVSVPFGSPLTFLVAVATPIDFLFSYTYDISNLQLAANGFSFFGSLIAGSVLGTLNPREYKVWKFTLSPNEVVATAPNPLWFNFTDGMVNPLTFTGTALLNAGVDSTGKALTALKDVDPKTNTCSVANFAALNITVTPGLNFTAWRKILPDLTTLNITTGTAPATSSSLAVGAVVVNSSVTSNLDFFNGTPNPYTITSVAVSLSTPNLTALAAANKTLLATDFTLSIITDSGTYNVPSFTATTISTTVTLTLTTPLTLGPLTSIKVNVVYAPKLKVLATQIVPYVAATAPALANAINVGRKVKVQLMGYPSSSPAGTVAAAVGDPLFVSGTV